ncbi:MAG: AAA family ATPase, partial [Pseudonocardiaceae bacterium]
MSDETPRVIMRGPDPPGAEILALLDEQLAKARANPAVPRIVTLHGETGRGKTYWIQRWFDALAAREAGYWSPCLTPPWPPRRRAQVEHSRKQVVPVPRDPALAPPFHWVGVGVTAAEGAIRMEPAAFAQQQLHEQWSATLRGWRLQKDRRALVLNVALDALGAAFAPVGVAKSIYENTSRVTKLLNDEAVGLSDLRRASLHDAFRAVMQASRPDAPPTIVVLDDAPSLGAESLHLLSGLVSDSPNWSSISDLLEGGPPNRQFLPSVLGDVPGPLLF